MSHVFKMVGVARFELTTSSSRTKRANQAALHPDTARNAGTNRAKRYGTPGRKSIRDVGLGLRGPRLVPIRLKGHEKRIKRDRGRQQEAQIPMAKKQDRGNGRPHRERRESTDPEASRLHLGAKMR